MAAIWMSVSLGFLPALAFGTLRNGKAFSRSFRLIFQEARVSTFGNIPKSIDRLNWRTLTCVLVYVYAYAIGYSYYRRGELEV